MSDLNPTKKVKIQHSRNAWQASDDGKLHPDDNSGYVLPIATKTVLGGMRVGDRLSVTAAGTVSADDQHYDDTEIREEIDAKQDELVSGETLRTVNGHSLLGAGNLVIEGGGSDYELPPATATTLGGVKKGARVTIAADGTLSADDQTFDPTALQTQITGNTQGIVDANARIDGKQDELVSGTSIKTVNGENLLGAGNIVIGGGGGGDYTLPPATSETLGGVKTGARVTIALDGTISADDQRYDDSGIRTDLAATNLRVTAVEDDVEALTPRVSAVEGEIVTLDGQVEDLTEDVAAHTTAIAGKQDTLVSGTTIKTVNGESLLGAGNVTVTGGGGSVTAGDGLRKTGDVISARVDKINADSGYPESGLTADVEGIYLNTSLGLGINPDNQLQVLINTETLKYTTYPFAPERGYLDVNCSPTGGLEAAPANAGLRVKLANDSINRGADGLSVPKYTNGSSISFNAVNDYIVIGVYHTATSGLESIPFDGLQVKCAPTGGIQRDASGLAVKSPTDGGLVADASGLAVKLRPTGGLSKTSTGLGVAVKAGGGVKVDAQGLQTTGFNFQPATAVTNRFPNGWVDIEAPASSSQSYACYEANGVGRYVATLGIAAGTGRGIKVFALLGRSDIPLLGTARVKFGYNTNARIYPLMANPDLLTTPLVSGDIIIPLWWDGRATTITVEFFYFVIP